jgi:hypothetical protein
MWQHMCTDAISLHSQLARKPKYMLSANQFHEQWKQSCMKLTSQFQNEEGQMRTPSFKRLFVVV